MVSLKLATRWLENLLEHSHLKCKETKNFSGGRGVSFPGGTAVDTRDIIERVHRRTIEKRIIIIFLKKENRQKKEPTKKATGSSFFRFPLVLFGWFFFTSARSAWQLE